MGEGEINKAKIDCCGCGMAIYSDTADIVEVCIGVSNIDEYAVVQPDKILWIGHKDCFKKVSQIKLDTGGK